MKNDQAKLMSLGVLAFSIPAIFYQLEPLHPGLTFSSEVMEILRIPALAAPIAAVGFVIYLWLLEYKK